MIDGGKALRRAINDVFGERALVHRCHRLWGAQTRSGSRGRAVFVDEPTETIPSADAERMGRIN